MIKLLAAIKKWYNKNHHTFRHTITLQTFIKVWGNLTKQKHVIENPSKWNLTIRRHSTILDTHFSRKVVFRRQLSAFSRQWSCSQTTKWLMQILCSYLREMLRLADFRKPWFIFNYLQKSTIKTSMQLSVWKHWGRDYLDLIVNKYKMMQFIIL